MSAAERCRQLRPHPSDAVAAVDDGLADVEVIEQRIVVAHDPPA